MRLSRDRVHFCWDNSLEPVAVVEPGEEITLEVRDPSNGQVLPTSDAGDIARLDFSKVNPVTGPIAVAGAEPGDAVVVSVLDIDVDDWGWTANIPGFGLLAAELGTPALAISTIAGGRVTLPFGAVLPVVPMVGTLGVALPEPGSHSVIPPSRHGGNLDIRHLTAGATIRLPVGVAGALLSLGDTHAAMGDGEVCGTGIEVASTVTVRVELERGGAPATPVLTTSEASSRLGPALATTGVGPDLMEDARQATRAMIDELCRRSQLTPLEAYLLASVSCDLKISEIVDAPNWVVSLHCPLSIVESLAR
ncbi:MAG TPA: acetamidase/formamidase family protein [Acidimicrobiales bacterium]|nr:acetamidase/formamidase family protein [Acidimicrobiales bacterium]